MSEEGGVLHALPSPGTPPPHSSSVSAGLKGDRLAEGKRTKEAQGGGCLRKENESISKSC